jgi:phage tail sheath protein FI
MAETLISPGVLARENDSSFVSRRPVTAGAAIIGPTVKGPVEIPTIVTTFSEYVNTFGTTFESGSANALKTYSYFTSIAAYNYFVNGGTSLLVARVVTGSATAQPGEFIGATTTTASVANDAIKDYNNSESFALETLSEGIIMNNSGSQTSGSLVSGSKDNVRYQIVNSNTSSGTFDLLIRRGDDNALTPTVLETFTMLSLDPNSSNFISRVIGDQIQNYNGTTIQIDTSGSYANRSNFIRVKNVNVTTLNYFDNNGVAKNAYTSSIPINKSGSFSGATGTIRGGAKFYNDISNTDTQGLTGGCYDNMINLLSNTDDFKFNILLTPGLIDSFPTHVGSISSIITNTQNRGDNIYVVDPVGYGKVVSEAVAAASSLNTSYAAMYWPWCQIVDPSTGNLVYVPASTVIGGVYAYNDSVAEPWFAPAGINRGGLSQVVRVEQKLSAANRDILYNGKVNPIATFPGTGIVVYGQKTLQTRASALDRVNVRRLLIALKSYISQVALNLVFEQNTIATRNQFLGQVNPYLTSVQQRQGLYAFKVIMDESNNTPDVIDRNELMGKIFVQPTKTAEFIYLDFNITPTGATFGA